MLNLTFSTTSESPAETFALGRQLGALLPSHVTIALHGDLGAGKTVLTQGIAAGLGIRERITSPTFTLVNEYRTATGNFLLHIDTYRLGSGDDESLVEATFLGLEEIFERDDAIIVIEWAERVAALLPTDHLQITLTYQGDQLEARHLTGIAHGPHSSAVLQQLAELASD